MYGPGRRRRGAKPDVYPSLTLRGTGTVLRDSTKRRWSSRRCRGMLSPSGGDEMNQYVTGAVIRRLREDRRMTQVELAERIHVSGKAVSKWETGISLR